MIKSFLYTMSLVFINLVFMFLTIVAFEGTVLDSPAFLIIFPMGTLVGIILMIYHAKQLWCKVAQWMVEFDNEDDCPHILHTRTDAERDAAIKAYQTAKLYGAGDSVAKECAEKQ